MRRAVRLDDGDEATVGAWQFFPSSFGIVEGHHDSLGTLIEERIRDDELLYHAIVRETQRSRQTLFPLQILEAAHNRHPNATNFELQLLSEVDRMPSTTASSQAPPRSESALSRRDAFSVIAEEERLLGGSGRNNDASAVHIGIPRTRPFSQLSAVKIPSGGPRPINTLNGHAESSSLRAYQGTKSKSRAGFQNTLRTEISRGGNVTGIPNATEVETEFGLPPAKKQKRKHQPSSPSSPHSIIDPLDNEAPGSISFEAPSQSVSRAPSAHSQGSGFQLRRSSSSTGGLQEHKNIERMMNSGPISKKSQRRLNSQNQQQSHHSPNMSSISNPIDLSGDDNEDMDVGPQPTAKTRAPYQASTRKDPPITRISNSSPKIQIQHRSTGEQSPFFTYITEANGPMKQQQTHSVLRDYQEDRPRRLANKFMPVDGLRRSSDVNMSSDLDELQEQGNTVGHIADSSNASSGTRSRQSSPTKVPASTSRPISSPELSHGLPESNIKPSTFATNESKKQARVQELIGRLREKKPPWAIEVAALSYVGELIPGPGIGLVFCEKDKSYAINRDGRATNIRILPDKLRKIQYAEQGGKVRFQSSKSGTEDAMLDLEFRSDKDASDLVSRLVRQSGCKAESHTMEHMEKIFQKKRQDFQKLAKFNGIGRTGLANMQSTPMSRNCKTDGMPTSSDAPIESRRRRAGRSLVDDLLARAAQDETMSTERDASVTANGLPGEGSLCDISKIIRPQPQNDHLRRSTRAYTMTTRASDLSSSELDDDPQKYSKVHGLGDPWKKPLTYPQEGKKRVTIDWSDLEKLDDGEFLNDNLISFYLRFLEQKLQDRRPNIARRVYFFNSYFFATLTNTHKSKKGFNYEGVRKWTRSVDLFTYDYIVVPINESMHWYLAIICNLPALDRSLEVSLIDDHGPADIGHADESGKAREFRPPSPSLEPENSSERVDDAREAVETDARISFADMSLDNSMKVSATDGVAADLADQRDQDQEMLDAQFDDTEPRAPDPKPEAPMHTEEHTIDNGDVVEAQDHSASKLAKSKKQKRKSMPPSITKSNPTKPVIIVLDSLGFSRSNTTRVLKDYLHEEARTKRGGMEFDDGQVKGINAKVPLQSNYSDCGLFLLGYVEKFLEDDPKDFIAKVIAREYDQSRDWTKLVPSTMRANIREQLQHFHELQEDQRRSVKKSGKYQNKGDQEPESSPTRSGPHQNETINQKKDYAPRDRSIEDKTNDNISTEQLLQGNENANEATIVASNPQELGVAEDQKGQAEPDDPSVIIVESQSQTATSAPKSTRTSPLPRRGSQAYPSDGELPSEIPDSQPSEPSKAPTEQTEYAQRSETARSFQNILEGHETTIEVPSARIGSRVANSNALSRRQSTEKKKKTQECGMIDVIDVDD